MTRVPYYMRFGMRRYDVGCGRAPHLTVSRFWVNVCLGRLAFFWRRRG